MTPEEITRLEEQLTGWKMRALDADAENKKLTYQLECVQPIIDAAKLWRASLEGDGWSKEDIESGICRPGIPELMKAVDALQPKETTSG